MVRVNNKQIKQAYKQYAKSDLYSLEHCYNSFSYAKQQAWNYCKELENEYDGYNLKIIGYNSMQFSVGFVGEISDVITGELKKAFFYITKSYDRYILTEDLENEKF